MKSLVLFCKSYRTDLNRVVRLALSIKRFNTDNIPFHVSVPAEDLALFHEHLAPHGAVIHSDDDILRASPNNLEFVKSLPGATSQQIVKSEFWRLDTCQSYLCLDSDAFFIRDFSHSDFLTSQGVPYTIIDEGRDLLEDAIVHKKSLVLEQFRAEASRMQAVFDRTGKHYSFGPMPIVWHRKVWDSLEHSFLRPQGLTLAQCIAQHPMEIRWYGEALLKFKAIPLHPCQPFFKVYHYAWQLDLAEKSVGAKALSELYLGVIHQSSWDRSMDWPHEAGGALSIAARRVKRLLGRV